MSKWIFRLATTVIVLFFLSAYGWVVKHVVDGDNNFGATVNETVLDFVSFFDLFEESVEQVKSLPKTFQQTPENFDAINVLEEDVWGLFAYSDPDKLRTVELRNLRNDSVAQSWQIDSVSKAQNRLMHPLMLNDYSLVYSLNGVTGVSRMDANGDLIWEQNQIGHHHGLNLDADGNIWACSYGKDGNEFILYHGTVRVDGRDINFIDNTFTLLDSATGEILFHKSVAELIRENGLTHLFAKTGNTGDPIHLNDVEPVLSDGPFWKRGDVFLSLRNMSCLMHYRPSSDSLLAVIEGPFHAQHDVDILGDSTLSIFNNNAHNQWPRSRSEWRVVQEPVDAGDIYSNVLYFNYGAGTFTAPDAELFAENSIYTFTEGLADHLEGGGYFVEEQNSGLLWVLKDGEVKYKNVLPSHHQGYHHLPNWARIVTLPQ